MADYFDLSGKHYLVIADRLSGWPEVIQVARGVGAAGLVKALREQFVRFGVPSDVSSDGGPEFASQAVKVLFETWGVQHIMSSAYLAKSNGRAELAVKATKRLLRDNVKSDGSLDTDKFVRAMLTKRNTPDNYSKLSPAEIVLGKKLSDSLPTLPKDKMFVNNEYINPLWRKIWRQREEAMQDGFVRNLEKIQKSTRSLKPLAIGQYVVLQNQNGPHPLRWDRTGVVVECKDYDQYLVKVHGSNRLTLRNRRFLRAYDPPANINQRLVFSPGLEDRAYSMNKGAGKQMRPVEDVHFSIPNQGVSDPDIVTSRDIREPSEVVPGDPSPEPIVHDAGPVGGPGEQVDRERDQPAVQVSPPRQEAGVRRSNRINKGETNKYKDYLMGDEVEKF